MKLFLVQGGVRRGRPRAPSLRAPGLLSGGRVYPHMMWVGDWYATLLLGAALGYDVNPDGNQYARATSLERARSITGTV